VCVCVYFKCIYLFISLPISFPFFSFFVCYVSFVFTADQEVINFLDGRVVELEQQQVAQAEVADVERVQSANREAAALQQVPILLSSVP